MTRNWLDLAANEHGLIPGFDVYSGPGKILQKSMDLAGFCGTLTDLF
jgi:hypothetical protein